MPGVVRRTCPLNGVQHLGCGHGTPTTTPCGPTGRGTLSGRAASNVPPGRRLSAPKFFGAREGLPLQAPFDSRRSRVITRRSITIGISDGTSRGGVASNGGAGVHADAFPASLVTASLAAAAAQTSFQSVSAGSGNGESGTMTTRSGRTSGIQFISITKGGSTGHVTVELRDHIAYVKGDSFAFSRCTSDSRPRLRRRKQTVALTFGPLQRRISSTVAASLTVISVV